ncbi:efflux RND transporter periplasmic adaptor subunit [Aestuariivirga sp.]|jgi:membrane fusion protein (multidrug efflux system)|uniref:efflux RND transporter periplasmic adaptor subunit n=1 Tax=Aestuariivirga sp. TaxID=2650926 RepID=UPI003784F44E
MTHTARWAMLAAALGLLPLLQGCEDSQTPTATAQAPLPAVSVVEAALQDLRPSVSFSARVEALEKVELRARIEGFLDKQNFAEGAAVKSGELLFIIEPAPYQAAVDAAQAAVAIAQARFDRSEIELNRQTTLVSKEAAAQTKLDDAQAARDEAKGALDKAKADLAKAKLQLSYTEIKAPLDGRIGKSSLSVGNYVGPNSGTLATIVSQTPIGVTFPVSQRDIIAVKEQADFAADLSKLTVYLELGKDRRYDETGTLDFVDVSVNPGTDAVNVRAIFPNPKALLTDGQLVTAIVQSATAQPTIVIPTQALQVDQQGTYVLTVDKEDKIAVTRVTPGAETEQGIAISKGLVTGDRVVVEGIQKVRPGQVVSVTVVSQGS